MDFSLAFWPIVSALIPEAIRLSRQCEETFVLCLSLFKKLAESSIDVLKLDNLVKEWGSLLLSHDCTEVCGPGTYWSMSLTLLRLSASPTALIWSLKVYRIYYVAQRLLPRLLSKTCHAGRLNPPLLLVALIVVV